MEFSPSPFLLLLFVKTRFQEGACHIYEMDQSTHSYLLRINMNDPPTTQIYVSNHYKGMSKTTSFMMLHKLQQIMSFTLLFNSNEGQKKKLIQRLICKNQSATTGVINGLPAKKASKFAMQTWITSENASGVNTAWCGVSTTFSISINSFGTFGSFSYTSSPTALISPCTRDRTNSISSILAPRPIFMITPSLPRACRTCLFMMW